MKIFFASQSFYPDIGGVSTHLLNLATGLAKRGNDVVEVQLRSPNEKNEDTIDNIKVFRIPKEPLNMEHLKGYSNFKERIYKEFHGQGKLFKSEPLITYGYNEYCKINLDIGKQIDKLLEEYPSEIVHIHDFQLLLIYKNIPRGIPLILTWHIPFTGTVSSCLMEFVIKHMKEYDKVIFSCQEYGNAAIKAGLPKEKIEIIPPIVNTFRFKPKNPLRQIKSQYNIPKGCKIILCVQRIDEKSGHIQLIKSLPLIIKKYPKVKLMFVGGDSLTSKISKEREQYKNEVYRQVKGSKLESNIIFTGNVDYKDIVNYYNSADIVALTSKNEGFGLAVSEAMCCAKPIIATNVPGIASQIKHGVNGFLVEVGDINNTANHIIKLLKNKKLCDRFGRNGLKIVKKKFSMTSAINTHYDLYRSLVKEKVDWRLEKINLKDIEAIITDFDRTITDKPGIVNAKILYELKSLGKPLILATGRTIKYAKELAAKYPVWDCVIAENGCYIYLPRNNMLISFNHENFFRIKAIVKKSGIGATFGHSIISVSNKHSLKIKKLLQKHDNDIKFKKNADEIMVLPNGVDKGISLIMALNYLKINVKKTIIIGDGENDIDLFKLPGFKIAVANAAEKLKHYADEITKNPSEKGIIEIITKLKM